MRQAVVFLLLLALASVSAPTVTAGPPSLLTLSETVRLHGSTGPLAFSCSAVSEIPQAECEALAALYNDTYGSGWKSWGGWLATNTPCSWYGVTCGGGHVTGLHQDHNQLSGGIPPELGNLANLGWLDLSSNQLSGSIPLALGDLGCLWYLNLSQNQLSGGIPLELGNLANLKHLYLYNNQLSGGIPPQLGNLAYLERIHLGHNQLSGSIPSELGNLPNLEWLSLSDSQLSESIPPQLGNLANLWYLSLYNNQLCGSIPAVLGNLAYLDTLYLDRNQLSGPLPRDLMRLNLYRFHFYDTNLCEPGDTSFQAWLASIDELRGTGVICGVTPTATPTAASWKGLYVPLVLKS